jgi:hypothetical protein
MPPRIHRLPRRATCTVLLLTQLTACSTWSRMPGPIEQQAGAERIPEARLILRSGAELPLRDVTVRADSVVGFFGDARERRAVPVAEVAAIDRRHVSGARTTGLVVGSLAAAFAGLIVVALFASGGTIAATSSPVIP